MNDAPFIRLENISQSFGDVRANHNISLNIRQGRILALLGENGAGKSTLMSLLAGQMLPDSGTIYYRGEPVSFTTTEKAIEAGIGMVYQHFTLFESRQGKSGVSYHPLQHWELPSPSRSTI